MPRPQDTVVVCVAGEGVVIPRMCSHASGRGEFDGHALWDVLDSLVSHGKSKPQMVVLMTFSSFLKVFHLPNELKAASLAAYHGKKYANQWRGSTARMEPISFSLNDSVPDLS